MTGNYAYQSAAIDPDYSPEPAELTENESLLASIPAEDDGPVDFGILFLAERESVMRQMHSVSSWEQIDSRSGEAA